VTAALHTIHVRVNDAATGQPTPVRMRFTNPAGEYFAPLGRLTEFATDDNEDVGGNLLLDGKQYAYIDGTCEIDLPAGQLLVEIHKGPEYTPRFLEDNLELVLNGQVYRQVEALGSPSSASLRLETKLPAAGWLALRCTGPLASPETNARERFGAHTSPIYIQVGGRRPPADGQSLAALLDHLDKLLIWVGQQSRGGNGHFRKRLVEILENARKLLAERGQI
jgi:hypothetical protein